MGLLDHGYGNRLDNFCLRSPSIAIMSMLDLVAFILYLEILLNWFSILCIARRDTFDFEREGITSSAKSAIDVRR